LPDILEENRRQGPLRGILNVQTERRIFLVLASSAGVNLPFFLHADGSPYCGRFKREDQEFVERRKTSAH